MEPSNPLPSKTSSPEPVSLELDKPTPADQARSRSILRHLIETRRPERAEPLPSLPLSAGVRG